MVAAPSPDGKDLYDGGTGANDIVTYYSRTANLNITIDNNANDGQAGELDNVRGATEDVIGGSGVDSIVATIDTILLGNQTNNLFIGGAGNDSLNGMAGNDILLGGDNNDTLTGDIGDDTLFGGPGTDTLTGGLGQDTYVSPTGDTVTLDLDGKPGSITEASLNANILAPLFATMAQVPGLPPLS
jgi:Ca2+-binding RTX toxin-like protein